MAENVHLTADVIIEFENGDILLAKRKNEPFVGVWGLPGGKLEGKETIEETACREAKEETGLEIELVGLVGVYSKDGRDPRGKYVSVAYAARPIGGKLEAASDAMKVMRVSDYTKLDLAFDHKDILDDYKKMMSKVND